MLLFFSLTSYPGEISHLNSPNRELSNRVRLVELYSNKIVDPSRSPCFKTVDEKRFECCNFLVLRPVLLKNAYFSSANRQLFIAVQLVELGLRKIVNPSRGASFTSVERNCSKFSGKKLKELYFFIFWPILLKLHI